MEFEESFLKNEWVNIDAILVTHKHRDHCLEEAIQKIVENSGTKFYTVYRLEADVMRVDTRVPANFESGDDFLLEYSFK